MFNNMEMSHNLINQNRSKKIIKIILVIVFILIFNKMFIGYYFTANQAIINNSFFEKNSTFVTSIGRKPFSISIYESETQYRSYIAHYSFPFWKSRVSVYYDKVDDKLQTIGGCSIIEGFTAFIVVNNDENVAYIEIGSLGDRITKKAPAGKITIFYWDKHIGSHELKPVAYSAENKPLYEYRYETIRNGESVSIIKSERWFPVE